jgi:hypothetical protein
MEVKMQSETSDLRNISAQIHQLRSGQQSFDGGGGGGYDPGMEERVKKLEATTEKTLERLIEIERDIAVVKSNYATTTTVSEAKNSIIMWVVGAIFVAQLLPMIRDFVRPSATPTVSTAPLAPASAPALPAK